MESWGPLIYFCGKDVLEREKYQAVTCFNFFFLVKEREGFERDLRVEMSCYSVEKGKYRNKMKTITA